MMASIKDLMFSNIHFTVFVTHRQIKLHCRGELFKYNNYFFQKLKNLATPTPLKSWMQSGIPEGCALAPPLVTTMVIFLLQVLLFFLQLCLLLRFVISMTVTMVITIPATVLVIVLDQHSQSTACITITMTESLGMFFIQI
jgi:hypothetical protein